MKPVLRSGVLVVVLGLAACPGDPAVELDVVVRTDPADTATCPDGGEIVRSGHDHNHNGALDDDEVVTSTPVCDEPSPPAVDPPLLTRMEPEPEGEHCVAGGIAFRIGRDRDGDGTLGDDEVERTEFECSDVLSRSVEVATEADLALLAGIRVISGDVVIEATALDGVDFPALEHITGNLQIGGNAALRRASLPVLTAVDGDVSIGSNDNLDELDLRQLTRVHDLFVRSNPALGDLAGLQRIQRIDGSLAIGNNANLASADLRYLNTVRGGVHVDHNPILVAVALRLGEETGVVAIEDNEALTRIELRADSLASVQILHNDALITFALDAKRVAGSVDLDGDRLQEVRFMRSNQNALEIAEGLRVRGPVEVLAIEPAAVVGGLDIQETRITELDRIPYVLGNVALEFNRRLTSAAFVEVRGDLTIAGSPMLHSFGELAQATIDGDVVLSGTALEDLRGLQLVREINGSLTIANNPQLTTPAMSELRYVHGDVRLINLPALESLGLPKLVEIAGVLGVDGTGLRHWDRPGDPGLGALQRASSVGISSNGVLEDIGLAALRSSGSWLEITSNPALRRLGLESFVRAENISLRDNASLPVCEIDALFARASADHEEQQGNDADGTCD